MMAYVECKESKSLYMVDGHPHIFVINKKKMANNNHHYFYMDMKKLH